MMRSGRIRRELTSSCRCRTAPLPSTFGGRVSSRTVLLTELKLGRVLDRDDRDLK